MHGAEQFAGQRAFTALPSVIADTRKTSRSNDGNTLQSIAASGNVQRVLPWQHHCQQVASLPSHAFASTDSTFG